MAAVSLAATTLLVLLALLHFYWALGGEWWLHKALPNLNGKPMFTPPRALTALVGIALLGFAYVAYGLNFGAEGSEAIIYTGWGLSLLFALRAVGDFNAVGFFKKVKSTPFATCDTRLYSPLCLALSAAFALLALNT